MILKKDWYPTHPTFAYPKSFVTWIDSINAGWLQHGTYEPFELYRKQSQVWMKDTDIIEDYDNKEDIIAFIEREVQRCKDNALYFLDKYIEIPDGQEESGYRKYISQEPQAIICFLFDCGYLTLYGKCRQIWFSTTMGGCAIKSLNFQRGFRGKFIANKGDKGESLFGDKIRDPFTRLPLWIRGDELYNYSSDKLALGTSPKKEGAIPKGNSIIEVIPPGQFATTGESPDKTFIDEISLVHNLNDIIEELAPSMYRFDHDTKKLIMVRQLIGWGTGSTDLKGSIQFESQWKTNKKLWLEKEYDACLIPVFFDVWARAGMTDKLYKDAKKKAYSYTGPEATQKRCKFHHHYCLTEEDMFMRGGNGLLEPDAIKAHQLRINSLDEIMRPMPGFFEPVYDYQSPTSFKDTPYKIVGATWKPLENAADTRVTAWMLGTRPENDWKHRFYQGTDPISHRTGQSNMASIMWDKYGFEIYKERMEGPVCMVDHRKENAQKASFLQCLLMGLYYNPVTIDNYELLEANIGDGYYEYCEVRGFDGRFIWNSELPVGPLQQKKGTWGVDKRSHNAQLVHQNLCDVITDYGDNIFFIRFFNQLSTYIEVPTSGKNAKGEDFRTQWKASDYRLYKDDVIDAMGYAKLAVKCFEDYEPTEISAKYLENQNIGTKLVRDKNNILSRVRVNKGHVISRIRGKYG